MSTGAIVGMAGSISGIGGITDVHGFSITRKQDVSPANSFSSAGWKEYVLGCDEASGSFNTIGAPAACGPYNASFETGNVGIGSEPFGGVTIGGKILVTSVGMAIKVNDTVTYPHSFVFTGVVSVTGL